MNGVYKKEMRSYRTTMTGYVFIAFILAVVGIYFAYINLNLASPDISGVFQSIRFIFLVIVPILTMRVIAEERKQRTDQLLYTLPLTVSEIVIGKYLALITMYAIPMGFVCFYPLIMMQNGTVNLKTSYLAILGFFLLGCADLAIGLFLSAITDNPVIAAVSSFGVLLLCYLMNNIARMIPNTAIASYISFAVILILLAAAVFHLIRNIQITVAALLLTEGVLAGGFFTNRVLFEGAIQKLLSLFYMNGRLVPFFDGILDISAVAYYLTIIVITLFLTGQTIRKQRWS